ncbi:hypothetical protein HDU67_003207, partial [Dinochytrium kinnereticum]
MYNSDSDEEISFIAHYPSVPTFGTSFSANSLSSTNTVKSNIPNHFWGYVDSGCTSHLTPYDSSLTNIDKSSICPRFTVASGHQIKGTGFTGDYSGVDETGRNFTINRIAHVPDADSPLLSVWQFLSNGYDVWFDHTTRAVNIGQLNRTVNHTVSAKGQGSDGMFKLILKPQEKAMLAQDCLLNTGLKFGYALPEKKEIARYLEFARTWLERQTGEKVLEWHMDRGGENRTTELRLACENSASANLIETGAPSHLWAEGLMTECYTYNRLVHDESGYKILLDDNDPKSLFVSRDVYFVEDQFDIKNPQPLASPVKITHWTDHHNDKTDFDTPVSYAKEGENEDEDDNVLQHETGPTTVVTTSRESSTPGENMLISGENAPVTTSRESSTPGENMLVSGENAPK